MKMKVESIPEDVFVDVLREEGVEEVFAYSSAKAIPVAAATLSGSESETVVPENTPGQEWGLKERLMKYREMVLHCQKCAELARTRKTVVFGSGNVKARLMFVGEAPGHDEDVQGLPFVGKAGQLLTKIIESIGLERKQVFIANVLKCRPPGNRQPQPDEILNCEPYLIHQIECIQPVIICALGTFAAQTLLKRGENISRLRGRFYDYHGAKVLCTYHPAYLLRNPEDKRKVWEDMKMIKRELESDL